MLTRKSQTMHNWTWTWTNIAKKQNENLIIINKMETLKRKNWIAERLVKRYVDLKKSKLYNLTWTKKNLEIKSKLTTISTKLNHFKKRVYKIITKKDEKNEMQRD